MHVALYRTKQKTYTAAYHQCYPVGRLLAKAKHDGVHSRSWYTADKEVDDIEGNEVSPYGQKLHKCEGTASEKTGKDHSDRK